MVLPVTLLIKGGKKETITLQHVAQWQSHNKVLVIIQCHPLVVNARTILER